MDVREKLFALFQDCNNPSWKWFPNNAEMLKLIDYLISRGVTVQEWISVTEPPKQNGYYLCVTLFSAVGNKKKYTRRILFWEDNVWIEKPNSFKIEKPLYWSQMLEMPQPPKGE